jgi:hypothetical protein
VQCSKCGEYQTAIYPLQNEKCSKCSQPFTPKEVRSIGYSFEQARLMMKEFKEAVDERKRTLQNLSRWSPDYLYLEGNELKRHRREVVRDSYIRGLNEKKPPKK